MPVQNLIPVILGITIARLAWIIYFFVRIAVNTKQEGAVFPSWIISVRNVEIDKAMSNVKAQGSNKVQIPNLMVLQKVRKGYFLSFLRKQESSLFRDLEFPGFPFSWE